MRKRKLPPAEMFESGECPPYEEVKRRYPGETDAAMIRRLRREREADKVDGYDRDDLGESPDY